MKERSVHSNPTCSKLYGSQPTFNFLCSLLFSFAVPWAELTTPYGACSTSGTATYSSIPQSHQHRPAVNRKSLRREQVADFLCTGWVDDVPVRFDFFSLLDGIILRLRFFNGKVESSVNSTLSLMHCTSWSRSCSRSAQYRWRSFPVLLGASEKNRRNLSFERPGRGR